MVTQTKIDEAADLAREFGLIGLSSEGHRKLALLLEQIRGESVRVRRRPRVEPLVEAKVELQHARPLEFPAVIVKGTGWRIRE